MLSLLPLLLVVGSTFAAPQTGAQLLKANAAQYAGAKVFRVPTGSNTTAIDSLVDRMGLERWTHASLPHSHVDVQVPPHQLTAFLREAGPGVEVMHEDLEESILAESVGMFDTQRSAAVAAGGLANDAWFNSYHAYADHLQWMNDLVSSFPNNAKIVTSGTSLGGKTITGLNIFGSGGSGTKPGVIWHGTVHAREWIASMTTEYLAYSLLSNYTSSSEIRGYVDKYDFYIFPVVNPDGFLYTQTSDRLWRKNRQSPPSGSSCYGRDINRNWAHKSWGQSEGASTDPCDDDYKGLKAADAPETVALANFLNARANSAQGAKMYLDFHSYSQLFMTPYGWSCSATAADATELNSLAAGFGSAVRAVYGTQYDTGPICTTIYPASGSSTDYAYDNSKIKYSFAAELRDTGKSGFVLPPAQILPTGQETFAGVRYILARMK